ncbi:glycoside hydrolase family 32 protein [Chitinophagaceae bacterium LB-8]|uniref:Glycoside hydrolase family 32 protein n=1 Tax=Paraflavisolibacter caeni TaxID=2982496 RepID=A0A9X2XUF6_9BACT|nr:glycoside hydrolase family 32 protein [Paraflavisolibacter caeni]MCU7548701.1 glycoside hydrolase family 32 protein [Paraflavisolibacter caeni]
MKRSKLFILTILIQFVFSGADAQTSYAEPYRPQIHFTPKEKWMNDPNGMVYHNGTYHLFYQYYPGATVWGPMHWGHATSTDLMHWQHQPIALYPDTLGYIFSGSAVVDKNNTSGFGKNGQIPLVAIFTHHDTTGEKKGRNDYQNQSIAYSLDNGKTWTKYAGNPVLKNPGIVDFRDPKVMWYEPQKKWVMTLATKDRITFYSAPDLKNWKKESEFGDKLGAHGGVWECPDLFPLDHNGKKTWVLIVNLNPGGPNGGSATQYFLGDFDGTTFTPSDTATRWLDYGPDEYAGITYSNTGGRKIFLGWMSNWLYADKVPTEKWRSAMTIPRDLGLKQIDNNLLVVSSPSKELTKIQSKSVALQNLNVTKPFDLSTKVGQVSIPCRIDLNMDKAADFSIVLSNDKGEEVLIGYDHNNSQYFIDRTKSGKVDFHKEFAARHVAPRFLKNSKMDMTLVVDVSSVEMFADDGLSVMTEIFFPTKPFNKISIQSADGVLIRKLNYAQLNSTMK